MSRMLTKATAAELAYFIEQRGMSDEFEAWYVEMPPVQRLLHAKAAARQVDALLKEGTKRGHEAAFVGAALDALTTAEKDAEDMTKRPRASSS